MFVHTMPFVCFNRINYTTCMQSTLLGVLCLLLISVTFSSFGGARKSGQLVTYCRSCLVFILEKIHQTNHHHPLRWPQFLRKSCPCSHYLNMNQRYQYVIKFKTFKNVNEVMKMTGQRKRIVDERMKTYMIQL